MNGLSMRYETTFMNALAVEVTDGIVGQVAGGGRNIEVTLALHVID